MSTRTIFYVWQGDTPKETGNDLIGEALAQAVVEVSRDLSLNLEVDRDTRNVPGAPLVIETIVRKIQQCTALVADLTYVAHIARPDGTRKGIPNPNVMMELGFALEAIGAERIIGVFNRAHGDLNWLPFDIAGRRLSVVYELQPNGDANSVAQVKRFLVRELSERLRDVLTGVEDTSFESDFKSAYQTDSGSFITASKLARVNGFEGGEADVFWRNGPQCLLRVIPREPLQINSRVELRSIAVGGDPRLLPFGRFSSAWDAQNEHGYVVVADLYRKDPAVLPTGFSQLFKSGELWGIDQRLLAPHHFSGDRHYFPSGAIQSAFVHGLANFLSVAEKRLQLKPPVKIVAGVAFVEGLRLAFNNVDWSDPCVEPAVFHEAIAESFSIDAKNVLRPFFEKLWDACGETYTETR